MDNNKYNFPTDISPGSIVQETYGTSGLRGVAPVGQQIYGTVPELPPRIDRASKPNGITPPSTLLPTASARNSAGTYGRSAHDRLFNGNKPLENPTYEDEYSTRPNLIMNATPEKRSSSGAAISSLDRKESIIADKIMRTPTSSVVGNVAKQPVNNGSYDSVSSYDSCNTTQLSMQNLRLGPNAPDDLKSVPNAK